MTDLPQPVAVRPQSRLVVGVSLVLVLLVAFVFGQTAYFDFVGYDDQLCVFQNPMVKRGLSWQAVGWAFSHSQVSNWVPLTTLSHMLDCQLFGLNAGAHHLVNVFWHAASVVLLFLVLRQLTGCLWRSAFVAAVFAVHPLRAESVAWVAERKDVLSAFFFILAIGAYVRWIRKPSRVNYFALVLSFVLGLMSKSMVATLPFVLLLLDYWPLGRLAARDQLRPRVREKLPLFVIAFVACFVTAQMPGLIVSYRKPFLERVANALVSCVIYLRQLVFPRNLSPNYLMVPGGPPAWKVVVAVLLLGAVSVIALALRKKTPWLLVGWLWYFGMLFPVLGIIQISSSAAHADRYTYLPAIGLAIAATWAVADWCGRWRHRGAILGSLGAAAIAVLAVCASRQTSYWRNDEALWTRALACNDADSVAHNGLGAALSKEGKKDEAIAQYRKALEIDPRSKVAFYNVGLVLMDKNEKQAAIRQYQAALNIDPAYAEAHNNLAIVLFSVGKRDDALAHYDAALNINPDYAEARYNLANALLQMNKLDDAIAQFRLALATTPDDARICNNLGIALAMKGRHDEAVVQFRKALQSDPGFIDADFDLAFSLVNLGKLDEAIDCYRRALRINPAYAKARFGLGKALLRKGDFRGAMECFTKVGVTGGDSLPTWAKLGSYLMHGGDLTEAGLCADQEARIDPSSPEIPALRRAIDVAQAKAQANNPSQ